MAQVRIKAPAGAFTGKRLFPHTFKKNAGPLSVTFYDGVSEPVPEDLAKQFVEHFKRYGIIPLDDKVIEIRKIEFVDEYKHGNKTYAAGETLEAKASFVQKLVDKGVAKYIDEQ